MNDLGLLKDILDAATKLRPEQPDPGVSVLDVAHSLGIPVVMKTGAHLNRGGKIEFSQPPRITVYRSAATAVTREMMKGDDRLLNRSEKFTVAHEIGHWILTTRLGVKPSVNRSSQKESYWAQEGLVNAFAGALLVPEWYLKRCLVDAPEGTLITVSHIRDWASRIDVSLEVLTRELCRLRDGIGFMRLTLIKRKKDKRHALKVDEVCSGENLTLPNKYKHILNERLQKIITNKATGVSLLRGCSFDEQHIDNYYISWLETLASSGLVTQRGELLPDVRPLGYWVSVAKEDAIFPPEGKLL